MSNILKDRLIRMSKDYKGVLMSDEVKTEQAGYQTTKDRVEQLILSGENLQKHRLGELENYDEISAERRESLKRYGYGDFVDEDQYVKRKLRTYEELAKQKELKRQEEMRKSEEAGEMESVEDLKSEQPSTEIRSQEP